MNRTLLLFAFGLLAGTLGGLMGVGGGLLLVPLLVRFVGMGQHEAQGTSLAFIVTAALAASAKYYGSDRLDLVLALTIAAGAVPGVLLGSAIAARTSGRTLRLGFGVLIAITAIRILAFPPVHERAGSLWPAAANVALGLGMGTLAGFLGVGGGMLVVPSLVLGEGIGQHEAQGVSLLVIVPVAIAGVISYAARGRIARSSIPATMAGGAAGGFLGALAAHHIRGETLSRIFGAFLLVVAAQMIFRRARGTVPRSLGAESGGTP
ncbi:MAG TPA: sulfite exporter TauE/SafE family protein [Candidatus Nitrosocosmicus sp.]|nr:sulfite exporter TauE/SafE family protein [Candidatus Nitrosocosmicus sp.]